MPFRALLACFGILFAAACDNGANLKAPTFHASENPALLSEWGMMGVKNGALHLSDDVTLYDLATPLFSDYALKLRTVWTPEGDVVKFHADRTFDFPVGSVITKTFYYPLAGPTWDGGVTYGQPTPIPIDKLDLDGLRLIETRLLVRRETGWIALPYVWNGDQTDAVLKRTGDIQPMTLVRLDGAREDFPYVVPNANQCAGCHATNATTKKIEPIGPKARHLNRPSPIASGRNQLDHWFETGLLEGDYAGADNTPRNALWSDADEDLDLRARSYLDANCSHCHNPNGAGDTSGLNLEPDAEGPALGFYKTPVAAGGGTGGRPYDIAPGDPEASITLYRMETTDPGEMMPELGRAVTHQEGVALIRDWIAQLDGANQ